MSIETARQNLHLQSADRWGHTEYSLHYHQEYLERKSGVSADAPDFARLWKNALQIDFNWQIDDGLIKWDEAGRVTDMGHAVYAADGSDERQPAVCPFSSLEEVWAFDAIKEYGLPDRKEQIEAYEQYIQKSRQDEPERLTPGGTYKTIVSGAIHTFGWDMLLMGASDPEKMEKVFDSFFRRSRFLYECWAETSAEAIITHDDFVWSNGAFMHPDIYREVIIPRYAELWEIIHQAGKKVIFCADGNFMEFAEDIVEAGSEALIFEPMNDFEFMAEKFGQRCCLIGSAVDCQDLTFGRWDKVKADIDRTFELLSKCRGAIIAVGNHLPANIPEDMLDKYFAELLPRLDRD